MGCWMNMSLRARVALAVLIALVIAVGAALHTALPSTHIARQIPFTEFVRHIHDNQVAAVVITGNQIAGRLRHGWNFRTEDPYPIDDLYSMLKTARIPFTVNQPSPGNGWTLVTLTINALPILLVAACVVFVTSKLRVWFPPGGNRPRGEVL